MWNFHSQFSKKMLLLCSVCSMRLADHHLFLELFEGWHSGRLEWIWPHYATNTLSTKELE